MNAVVVGATGGIGAALVEQLAKQDNVETVFALAREPARVPGRSLPGVRVLPIDLLDEASVQQCAAAVQQQSPAISMMINAVGVLQAPGISPERRLEHVEASAVTSVMALNSVGPMLLAKHFVPLLKHHERAVLANLSARVGSISDNRLGGWYAYRCSKAALNMFTKTLAIELKRRAPNVVCLALHPGTVDTALSQPFQKSVDSSKLFSPHFAATRLLSIAHEARPEDSGAFIAWDGQPIGW